VIFSFFPNDSDHVFGIFLSFCLAPCNFFSLHTILEIFIANLNLTFFGLCSWPFHHSPPAWSLTLEAWRLLTENDAIYFSYIYLIDLAAGLSVLVEGCASVLKIAFQLLPTLP